MKNVINKAQSFLPEELFESDEKKFDASKEYQLLGFDICKDAVAKIYREKGIGMNQDIADKIDEFMKEARKKLEEK